MVGHVIGIQGLRLISTIAAFHQRGWMFRSTLDEMIGKGCVTLAEVESMAALDIVGLDENSVKLKPFAEELLLVAKEYEGAQGSAWDYPWVVAPFVDHANRVVEALHRVRMLTAPLQEEAEGLVGVAKGLETRAAAIRKQAAEAVEEARRIERDEIKALREAAPKSYEGHFHKGGGSEAAEAWRNMRPVAKRAEKAVAA